VGIFGSGVTLHFEPGSSISPAACTCIYTPGNNNVIIDGAGVGIIENTANGTGLAFQTATQGIMASGSANLTVKNLIIRNLYVHTNVSDVAMDGSMGGGVYANGMSGTITVTGCTFSNVPWCVNLLGPQSVINVLSNTFVNYDHGVGMGTAGNVTAIIGTNIFGSTANWDTGSLNAYHHDGIHFFGNPAINSLIICNNLFTGDWGANNTMHVYLETGPANALVYNNVFIQYPGDYLNNGFLCAYGTANQVYNNTFVGASVANSVALTSGGQGTVVQNNLFTGVTTFISSRSPTTVFANNLYASPTPGGNAPWSLVTSSTACYNALAAWQGVSGEANAIFVSANVPLNNDASLAPGNPAIGAGLNLSNLFQSDFKGLWRGSNWDIGAFAANGMIPPVVLSAPSNLRIVLPQAPVIAVTNFMVASVTTGSLRNNATVAVGRAFVANANVTVIALGRWVVAGNSQSHVVSIYNHCNLLGSVTVNTAGAAPGAFVYGTLPVPVPLNAGCSYSILSAEVAGQDQWYDNNTIITLLNSDTTASCPEYLLDGVCCASSVGPYTFGPVDAQYTKP
jgi:hypothetical protein